MKKKQIIFIILGVIVLIAIVLGLAYHFRDKRTYELNIPQVENIESILVEVVEKSDPYPITYDKEENIKQIVDILVGVKRITKKESINDFPTNADYIIKVKLNHKENESSILFLYKRNNKYYIEQPYNGIYKISENEYKKINDYTIIPNEEDNNKKISMSIKENTLTPSGITIIMKNNSSQIYHYGPEYYLEKYENGTFKTYEPKEPLVWNTVLYNIKVNEEKEEVIEWKNGYDDLESGKYRLVRYFTSEENITSSANVEEKYYVEFEIKSPLSNGSL